MAPAANARRVVKETMLTDLVLWVGRLNIWEINVLW